MRSRAAVALGTLGLLAAFLFGALTGLRAVFLNDGIYTALMDDLSVYEGVGISREEQALINGDISAYLSGESDSLERSVTLRGEKVDCAFNGRELSHMADVRRLFLAGLRVWKIIGLCAVLLLSLSLRPKQGKTTGRCLLCAGLILILEAGMGIILLASADFSALFVRFHELIFDNDLWLLDPATDALIRMLPEAFFERIALMGAEASATGGLVTLAAAAGVRKVLTRLFKR